MINWKVGHKVKQLIYKWKNLTMKLAKELLIARKILSVHPKERQRTSSGTFVPVGKNWTTYYEDIDSSRQVLNRWPRRFLLAEEINEVEPPKGQSQVLYADPLGITATQSYGAWLPKLVPKVSNYSPLMKVPRIALQSVS